MPLVILWTVPVAVVAIAIPAAGSREQASVAPPLPSVVTVGSQSTDYRTAVSVSVEVGRAGQIRSPVSGLLTALTETEGAISAGTELFSVDGVPVLAQPGTAPLYRELSWGDEGADVEVLGQFLIDAGLLESDLIDETFGPSMRAAVVQLQDRVGVRTDGVFRPTYVAYVPQSAGALGKALMAVGSTVAAGEVVLNTAPVPSRITFSPASTGASLANLQDARLSLTFTDVVIPLSSSEPTVDELVTVHAALQELVANGKAQLQTGDDSGSGEPEQYSGGLLSLAEPQVHGVVPGTAVHVTSTGTQCLFRQKPDSNGWESIPVPTLKPAVGMLGAVYVDPALIDIPIARDPLVLTSDVLADCR